MPNPRTKGNNYERDIVKELAELLNDDRVGTTRNHSKVLDNLGIDIVFLPGHPLENQVPIQTKTSNRKSQDVLEYLAKVSQQKGLPVAFVKVTEPKGDSKRNFFKGEYVAMTKEVYYKLLKLLYSLNIFYEDIDSKKSY